MSVILVEAATGAQILPRPTVRNDRQTVTEWQAHIAADADMRSKHPAYAEIAGRLNAVEVRA